MSIDLEIINSQNLSFLDIVDDADNDFEHDESPPFYGAPMFIKNKIGQRYQLAFVLLSSNGDQREKLLCKYKNIGVIGSDREKVYNKIPNWGWKKPEKEGLYIFCLGDVEVIDNIRPVKIVDNLVTYKDKDHADDDWPVCTVDEVSKWQSSFKFARLCVGSESKLILR